MIKSKIIKPSIPLLFLDTFFFIDLVRNRHQRNKSSCFNDELKLVDLIDGLTKKRKLLCPYGDQEEEYELGFKYEDEIRKEQVQLSQGIRAMHYYGVQRLQTQVAIMAYRDRKRVAEYDYRSLFSRDPVDELGEQLARKFIVSVHLPMSRTYLDKRRKTKKELARNFEKMRQEKIKYKVKFGDWARHETLGTLDAIKTTLKTAVPKLATRQGQLTQDEINGLQIFGDFLAFLSHYLKREATPKDVGDFLKSEYYAAIPYISIQSRLYATMWSQSGRVKESDNFDFYQTSQMLPFSTYFLTDSSLKHRITSSPLRLDREYKVKVYSMREIKDLIKDLKKL